MSTLINDDCLYAMKEIRDSSIDMIYLDPPFFTQQKQKLVDENGNEYEYNDKWDSMEVYLSYIKERLIETRRLLKNTGSIFLHCDTSASHYLKVLMDDIFGRNNFQSEIIWTYKRWSNSKKGLLKAHQTIFFYSKTSEFKFNTIYNDYSATTNIDQILQDRVKNENGKSVYKRDAQGEVIQTNQKKGVPLSDVWEIPFLNPKAKERVGYPTQKPILLIEKILSIATDENDLILDPFCGSGTALVAAKLMNRQAIGIDINKNAIELVKTRLQNPIKTDSILLEKGEESYKNKSEFENSILKHLDCNIVQRNKGIDAILKKFYNGAPVAIKIQKPNESIRQSINFLKIASAKKKCSFSILILIETNTTNLNIPVPDNMFLIDSYQIHINKLLSK